MLIHQQPLIKANAAINQMCLAVHVCLSVNGCTLAWLALPSFSCHLRLTETLVWHRIKQLHLLSHQDRDPTANREDDIRFEIRSSKQ